MELSIVTSLYKSRNYLEEFIALCAKACQNIGIENYEIIFVNDGSPDDSLSYLLNEKQKNSKIVIIDLARNFGHHSALKAGLSYSKGERVFLIDNDLETSPLFLIECYSKMDESNADVVYGYQERRKGKFVERVGGDIFWKMINILSDVKIPHNLLTERLMTRRYVNEFLTLQDANLFIGGMFAWLGFEQIGLPVAKKERVGKSTYSFRKRFGLMVNAITSFSGKPLEYLFYLGLIVTLISFLFLIALVVAKLILKIEFQIGWTSIIGINFLVLGLLSTFLGFVGIYLFKIFKQVQGRPTYIIRKIYK